MSVEKVHVYVPGTSAFSSSVAAGTEALPLSVWIAGPVAEEPSYHLSTTLTSMMRCAGFVAVTWVVMRMPPDGRRPCGSSRR